MHKGAMDGKHVTIRKPNGSGSLYLILFCCTFRIVRRKLQIFYCDFGNYGSASDGGIFDRSDLNSRMQTGLNLPPSELLPNSNTLLPYFMFGDCAFPSRSDIMKPFPENQSHNTTIFNYQLYLFIGIFILWPSY